MASAWQATNLSSDLLLSELGLDRLIDERIAARHPFA